MLRAYVVNWWYLRVDGRTAAFIAFAWYKMVLSTLHSRRWFYRLCMVVDGFIAVKHITLFLCKQLDKFLSLVNILQHLKLLLWIMIFSFDNPLQRDFLRMFASQYCQKLKNHWKLSNFREVLNAQCRSIWSRIELNFQLSKLLLDIFVDFEIKNESLSCLLKNESLSCLCKISVLL